MDKIARNKAIVRELVKEIADMTPSTEGVENQLIIDDERGHYILFSVGWEDKERHYATFVHIDVKSDGKVWLQHDGTDLKIALELIEKGIPKEEIVLAFHAPFRRKHTGFAVA